MPILGSNHPAIPMTAASAPLARCAVATTICLRISTVHIPRVDLKAHGLIRGCCTWYRCRGMRAEAPSSHAAHMRSWGSAPSDRNSSATRSMPSSSLHALPAGRASDKLPLCSTRHSASGAAGNPSTLPGSK